MNKPFSKNLQNMNEIRKPACVRASEVKIPGSEHFENIFWNGVFENAIEELSNGNIWWI